MKRQNKKSMSLRSKRKNLLKNETILTTDSDDSSADESNKQENAVFWKNLPDYSNRRKSRLVKNTENMLSDKTLSTSNPLKSNWWQDIVPSDDMEKMEHPRQSNDEKLFDGSNSLNLEEEFIVPKKIFKPQTRSKSRFSQAFHKITPKFPEEMETSGVSSKNYVSMHNSTDDSLTQNKSKRSTKRLFNRARAKRKYSKAFTFDVEEITLDNLTSGTSINVSTEKRDKMGALNVSADIVVSSQAVEKQVEAVMIDKVTKLPLDVSNKRKMMTKSQSADFPKLALETGVQILQKASKRSSLETTKESNTKITLPETKLNTESNKSNEVSNLQKRSPRQTNQSPRRVSLRFSSKRDSFDQDALNKSTIKDKNESLKKSKEAKKTLFSKKTEKTRNFSEAFIHSKLSNSNNNSTPTKTKLSTESNKNNEASSHQKRTPRSPRQTNQSPRRVSLRFSFDQDTLNKSTMKDKEESLKKSKEAKKSLFSKKTEKNRNFSEAFIHSKLFSTNNNSSSTKTKLSTESNKNNEASSLQKRTPRSPRQTNQSPRRVSLRFSSKRDSFDQDTLKKSTMKDKEESLENSKEAKKSLFNKKTEKNRNFSEAFIHSKLSNTNNNSAFAKSKATDAASDDDESAKNNLSVEFRRSYEDEIIKDKKENDPRATLFLKDVRRMHHFSKAFSTGVQNASFEEENRDEFEIPKIGDDGNNEVPVETRSSKRFSRNSSKHIIENVDGGNAVNRLSHKVNRNKRYMGVKSASFTETTSKKLIKSPIFWRNRKNYQSKSLLETRKNRNSLAVIIDQLRESNNTNNQNIQNLMNNDAQSVNEKSKESVHKNDVHESLGFPLKKIRNSSAALGTVQKLSEDIKSTKNIEVPDTSDMSETSVLNFSTISSITENSKTERKTLFGGRTGSKFTKPKSQQTNSIEKNISPIAESAIPQGIIGKPRRSMQVSDTDSIISKLFENSLMSSTKINIPNRFINDDVSEEEDKLESARPASDSKNKEVAENAEEVSMTNIEKRRNESKESSNEWKINLSKRKSTKNDIEDLFPKVASPTKKSEKRSSLMKAHRNVTLQVTNIIEQENSRNKTDSNAVSINDKRSTLENTGTAETASNSKIRKTPSIVEGSTTRFRTLKKRSSTLKDLSDEDIENSGKRLGDKFIKEKNAKINTSKESIGTYDVSNNITKSKESYIEKKNTEIKNQSQNTYVNKKKEESVLNSKLGKDVEYNLSEKEVIDKSIHKKKNLSRKLFKEIAEESTIIDDDTNSVNAEEFSMEDEIETISQEKSINRLRSLQKGKSVVKSNSSIKEVENKEKQITAKSTSKERSAKKSMPTDDVSNNGNRSDVEDSSIEYEIEDIWLENSSNRKKSSELSANKLSKRVVENHLSAEKVADKPMEKINKEIMKNNAVEISSVHSNYSAVTEKLDSSESEIVLQENELVSTEQQNKSLNNNSKLKNLPRNQIVKNINFAEISSRNSTATKDTNSKNTQVQTNTTDRISIVDLLSINEGSIMKNKSKLLENFMNNTEKTSTVRSKKSKVPEEFEQIKKRMYQNFQIQPTSSTKEKEMGNRKITDFFRKGDLKPIPNKTIENTAYRINVIDGKLYKPRKLFKGSSWCNDRLYKHFQKKIGDKHPEGDTIIKSEELMKSIFESVKVINKSKSYLKNEVDAMKQVLARNGLITTTFDFFHFVNDFLPHEFSLRVVPRTRAHRADTEVPYDPNQLFKNIEY